MQNIFAFCTICTKIYIKMIYFFENEIYNRNYHVFIFDLFM